MKSYFKLDNVAYHPHLTLSCLNWFRCKISFVTSFTISKWLKKYFFYNLKIKGYITSLWSYSKCSKKGPDLLHIRSIWKIKKLKNNRNYFWSEYREKNKCFHIFIYKSVQISCRTQFSQLFIIRLKRKYKIFFWYKYSFLSYLKNLWVPIGIKPAPGDHESDDENSFLLLTNLIL